MDGLDDSVRSRTPPPPPMPGGTPPSTSEAKTTPSRSPRPPLAPSLAARRPSLPKRGDSSQGSFRKSGSGRDRAGSLQSVHSQGSSRRLDGSRYVPPATMGGGGHPFLGNAPPMSSDARLIMASLDEAPVEDQAEATLLDVLERRRVHFPNLVPPVRVTPSRHRRTRSRYLGEGSNVGLPNMDLTNLGMSGRPASAPSSSEGGLPQPRPSLHQRSISNERSASKRNLLQRSSPSMRGTGVSSDWAFDSQGELEQPFLSEGKGEVELGETDPLGDSHNLAASNEGISSTFPGSPREPGRHERSRVPMTALPLGLDRGISDVSTPTCLTAPAQRARHVALTMKAMAGNNAGEDIHSGLPDLLNILEAQRESDDQSMGSERSSSRRVQNGTRTSAENRSFHSGTRSAENQSAGGSAGRSWTHRPFSRVTTTPFGDGLMTNVDRLFDVAEHVEELCQIPEEEEEDELKTNQLAAENANFLSALVTSHPEVPTVELEDPDEAVDGETGVADEQTPMLQGKTSARNPRSLRSPRGLRRQIPMRISPDSRFFKVLVWWADVRKHMKVFAVAFDAASVKQSLLAFLQNEVSTFIVPALAISAFLYYHLGNPIFAVFGGDASISWSILFVLRNYLTLQLAYAVEYLVVVVMAQRSSLGIQLIGPLATLYTINAKGWPFVVTTWGLLNFLLIQDGHEPTRPFFNNWLFFTDIEMFTADNLSGGIVHGANYERFLYSLIIAGVATSLKRTIMALYLGKRIYVHYKPKLEHLLKSMILLTEVAELGSSLDDFEFEKLDNTDDSPEKRESKRSSAARSSSLYDKLRTSTMNDFVAKKQTTKASINADSDEETVEEEHNDSPNSKKWNRLRSDNDSSSDEDEPFTEGSRVPSQEALQAISERECENDPPIADENFVATDNLPAEGDEIEPPVATVNEPVQGLLKGTSTTTHIKSLLDDWEEPANKLDKIDHPTIHDILQFRKALAFLDDTHPFGSSFGPAFTRDSCIKSAKFLYKRLLALSPGDQVLQFDIIGVLAYTGDGMTFDNKKARALVRLFRPDKFDEVTLLAFVSSCDGVYKRLRYLRASVDNSTVIDSVLEDIFNGVFAFFLAISILSVLHLNPWTLLVSMSTVLVSFAFALGPSAAKLIEGMIMIAVRRPFDLGDRISIVDSTGPPDNSDDPGYHDTWLVEDVNLFTTTLRLSRTNEISTVNNGTIANTRIVNHGRSMNALVNFTFHAKIEATYDQVQIVKDALAQYIRDNPRVWHSLVNFRITKVDPETGFVAYSARVEHVKSWQDLLPVLSAKGDLEYFCTEILNKLGILFQQAFTSNKVYIKELPDHDVPLPGDTVPTEPTEMLHEHND